ncbi:MAG: divalent-cation tolerance protein CutA [Deltaproteobacteria bacterium HGW-Deltaproteobacteria-14]|jgi:periplasmic divalent cation tolerance protein|nr:MAG: divalent-cation tolerance protein CutA [Deltaproteobacteria bacterium HGW-Deltaproteobacteria-14]
MSSKDVRVVLCTCPAADASRIARTVLEERLVACVNVVSGVKSLYWWNGGMQEDTESLLVLKTPSDCYARLERRLQEIHPYDVPEVLSLAVAEGAETYISWVADNARC